MTSVPRFIVRWVAGTLTFLSWILFLTALVACVRTAWIADQFSHQSVTEDSDGNAVFTRHVIVSVSASLKYGRYVVRSERSLKQLRLEWEHGARPIIGWMHGSEPAVSGWSVLGRFGWASGNWGGIERAPYVEAMVPWWAVAALGLPLSARSVLRLWRRYERRRRRVCGRCETCGYDLRESPQRCPECGTAPITA